MLFWFGYVAFKTTQNFIPDGSPAADLSFTAFMMMFWGQLALLLVKIPMVYALFFVLNRFLSRRWGIAKSILATILVFSVSMVLFVLAAHYIVLEGLYNIHVPLQSHLNMASWFYNFFVLASIAAVALTCKLVRLNIRQKAAQQEIVKKKLETELRFLKSQTNPHFLFNTLNNIYALARKKSDATAETVLKLSKLLRFMLYEAENASIPIAEELRMIESYIELEKIRYSDKLEISYTHSIDNNSQPIAPLILLPFIENAFKHGAGESRFDSFIHIEIFLHAGQLRFMIENSNSTQVAPKKSIEKIGLSNITRQLELLYPGHELTITNADDRFKVLLNLNLHTYATL